MAAKIGTKAWARMAADVIAFGGGNDGPYTVVRGLDAMAADPELAADCVPVFGCDVDTLRAIMTKHNMLDLEFQIDSIFEANYGIS